MSRRNSNRRPSMATGQLVARPRIKRWFVASALAIAILGGCVGESLDQRVARATMQYADGEYRRAAIELQNVLQDDPQNVQATVLLGRVWLALGDPAAAQQRLADARSMGAPAEEFALPLATALLQSGQAGEARTELERVPASLRTADWFAALGDTHLALNEGPAAEAAFRQARALDANHYVATLGLGRAAVLAAALPAAFEQFDAAVALDTERYEAYALRGHAQISVGSLAAAERDLARAAELLARGEPSATELNNLLALAQVQLTLKRVAELRATAGWARARAGDTPVTTYIEGLADFGEERYQEAVRNLQLTAQAISSDDAQLSLLLGLSNLAVGNFGQAENHFLAALEQRPGDATAVRALAEARRRQGRTRAAIEALDLAPGSANEPAMLLARGILYLENDQPEVAVGILERAAAAAAGDIGVQLYLARAYLETERAPEALALFDARFDSDARPALEVAIRLLADVVDAGGLTAASAAAAKLAAEQPADPNVAFGVALFYQLSGATEEASKQLERAAELDPAFVAPRLAMAGLATAAGETDRARVLYESVVATAPGDFRGRLGLARLALAAGATDEARRLVELAAEAAPTALAPRLLLAQFALAAKDISAAQAALAAARSIDEGHPDVATLSAQVALEQGQIDVAMVELQKAANVKPESAERWHRLGRLQLGKDNAAARVSLRRAVGLEPNNAEARFDLGQVERALGNASAARLLGRELQADFPEMNLGYLLEADLLAASGEHAAAAQVLERAYDRRPNFEMAARAFRARQMAGAADPAAPLDRWLASTPDDARAWLLLAQAQQGAGQPDAALAAYDKVIALEPRNTVALNNAAWLYYEAGNDRALDYAQRAYEQAPDAPAVLDTYGWILLDRGDVAGALAHLRKAAQGAPDVADIQYHFAAGLVRSGDTGDARALLERLLGDGRPFASREKAEALLADL
jgi:cellulose synthase operon protein C